MDASGIKRRLFRKPRIPRLVSLRYVGRVGKVRKGKERRVDWFGLVWVSIYLYVGTSTEGEEERRKKVSSGSCIFIKFNIYIERGLKVRYQ